LNFGTAWNNGDKEKYRLEENQNLCSLKVRLLLGDNCSRLLICNSCSRLLAETSAQKVRAKTGYNSLDDEFSFKIQSQRFPALFTM
jgi:hypothetical protein